jgi:internalin A
VTDQTEYTQRMFLKILRLAQEQQEVRCPSIFSVVRGKSGRIGGAAFELRLYCEEPGSWHPLPEPAGRYQIHEPAEWLQKIGPHLNQLLTVLKHAAPLAGPVLGMAVGTVSERVTAEIDAMTELINQIPEPARMLAKLGKEHDSRPGPEARAATEADFRALESLLNKLDPDHIWGGLSRMTTPEGLTLYLCREHYEGYHRTVRLSNRNQSD